MKWNKFTLRQERTLVVTNLAIYNFLKKSKPAFTVLSLSQKFVDQFRSLTWLD